MTSTETVELTISGVEAKSIAEIASKAAWKIGEFANKHGCGDQYDQKRTEEDLIVFLAKRNVVGLQELEISILDDGSVDVGSAITGTRRADLLLRFNYSGERRHA